MTWRGLQHRFYIECSSNYCGTAPAAEQDVAVQY
jgi:hypothetical protein